MKKATFILVLLFLSFYSHAQKENIESSLSELNDLTFKRINSSEGYETNYVLRVRQPLDHSDTTKGFFHQKVYLSHKGFEQPTVIVTAGYDVNRNRISELTGLLKANQIMVEHRYFGHSMPDSIDYNYLNLEQATADLHHIRQIFANIYSTKWLSTGISKGGATTIFYRYFYPNDVDVSVPYVAPINKSYEEPRIYDFFDTIGSDECRNKIRAFQVRILQNREQILPLLKFYSLGADVHYSYLSLAEAFEYAVMEYPFSFWQWGHSCDNIPSDTASVEEITEYFIAISGLTLFSDESIRHYNSHYYQSATEMGYYGYETSEFKDLLVELPTDTNPHATFFTFEMTQEFDGTLLVDVNQWLETEGDKFIYIYGGNDTWTASGVAPNDKVDSEWFILKGKHHGTARISEMSTTERRKFISTIEKWLSIEIGP